MAENEIIDLGHATRWARTRRALKDPDCPADDVAAAMSGDMERMLRALARVLRTGQSLSALLRLSLGSSAHVQAVIAQYQEKSLASLVNDARNRCGGNDPDQVAATAARLLIERLADQAECRAARLPHFQQMRARDELHAQAKRAFGEYEGDLRSMLASALRDGAPVRFKRRLAGRRPVTAKQMLSLSVLPKQAAQQDATRVK